MEDMTWAKIIRVSDPRGGRREGGEKDERGGLDEEEEGREERVEGEGKGGGGGPTDHDGLFKALIEVDENSVCRSKRQLDISRLYLRINSLLHCQAINELYRRPRGNCTP